MHGAGNDFVLLDLRQQDFPINPQIARQLANRHTGIGCDQILVLRPAPNHDQLASFEIWNSDGSTAEQCGNGVRCLGLYLHMRNETTDGKCLLAGPAGEVKILCLDDGLVQVDMGKPIFTPAEIPLLQQKECDWYELNVNGMSYQIGAASMGNPHVLMLVDDIKGTNVDFLGSSISRHPSFPEGCNAGFAQLIDRDRISLRVFERGACETLACGSGASAAMCILRRAGFVEQTVNVTQAGGDLIIEWTGGENPVIMTGPATHVYEGILT
jgi:diaminopimelate epimerase